jgi:hypothetical protein
VLLDVRRLRKEGLLSTEIGGTGAMAYTNSAPRSGG